METGKKLFEENKKLNGPDINIIPLDFIELNKDNIDSDEDDDWLVNEFQGNDLK